MKVKIKVKYIWIFLGLVLGAFLLYQIFNFVKPVDTIFIKGAAFSFRDDVRKALKVETFPNEGLFNELFMDYKTKNVTILFKPGNPKTNAIYQLETFEIVYKLTRYDELTKNMFRSKKVFDAQEIETYENITREEGVLKIILVPPEFSNQTRVTAGGNKIWIYGKTEKEFDLAVMKAILNVMNVINY